MPYHILCIIPYDRHCHFDGFDLRVDGADSGAATEAAEERHLEETRVTYVGKDGVSTIMSLLELSILLGFAYATHLQWMCERDLRIMPVTWGLPQFADETMAAISPTALELGIINQLETGELSPDIYVKWVDETIGHGVFASRPLSAGHFCGEYTGIVLMTQSPGAYSLNYPCLDGGHEISAADTGNLMRFINHSSSPNSSFQRVFHENIIHTVVRTTVRVAADEQICVDYSPSYWVGRGVAPEAN